MENWQLLITVATTILGSSALFGFIEYLLDRRDKRAERYKAIEAILDKFRDDIKGLSDNIERRAAIDARTRIIRASDEMRLHMKHSQEFFNQIHDDINLYEQYCENHSDFKNNKAVHAIENINKVYQERLEDNDFL